MGKQSTPKRGVTPPKGQPTRSRNGSYGGRRVFGPALQWFLVVLLLVMIFAILVVVTDGGDFNPFNDGAVGGLVTSPFLPVVSRLSA